MHGKSQYADIPVREKLETISSWLAEKKGADILALDLTRNHTFTEGIIIVTANSIRHARGLADHVLQESKTAKFEFLRMEGYQSDQWILLDMNDVVVSVFLEDARELYRLEDLWKSADAVVDSRDRAPAI